MKFTIAQRAAITECLKLAEMCVTSTNPAVVAIGAIQVRRAQKMWRGRLTQRLLTEAEIGTYIEMFDRKKKR